MGEFCPRHSSPAQLENPTNQKCLWSQYDKTWQTSSSLFTFSLVVTKMIGKWAEYKIHLLASLYHVWDDAYLFIALLRRGFKYVHHEACHHKERGGVVWCVLLLLSLLYLPSCHHKESDWNSATSLTWHASFPSLPVFVCGCKLRLRNSDGCLPKHINRMPIKEREICCTTKTPIIITTDWHFKANKGRGQWFA